MKKLILILIAAAGLSCGSLLNAQTNSDLDDIAYYRQELEKYRELAVKDRDAYLDNVVETLLQLAYLHIEREELLEAVPLFEELVELDANQEVDGLNIKAVREDFAELLENIGEAYYGRHDYNTTEKYYLRSLALFEKLAEDNPTRYLPDVARLLVHIGNIYHNDRKNYRTAEKYYLRSLPIYEKLVQERPNELSNFSVVLRNIGLNHHERKRYGKAEPYYLRSLQIREQLAQEQPNKHLPNLVSILEDIASNFLFQKNYAEANKHFQRSLQIVEQLEEEDAAPYLSRWIDMYGAISWNCLFFAKYDHSEKFAHRALELDDTQTWVKVNLAHALLFQNRFPEAEEIYRELSQIIEKNEKTFTPTILKDFKALKKVNVIPKNHKADVKKIKKQLRR